MSHFRAVHRGQFFTTMKTTTVRKLLPESWGFLCPVHTPDGGPCGLLQHLALKCTAICEPPPDRGMGLKKVVVALGVTPSGVGGGDGQLHLPFTYLPVLIDGEVVGGAPAEVCAQVASALRYLKVNGTPGATTSASGSDSSSSSSAKGKGKGKAAVAGKKGKNKKKNSSDDSSSDNGHSNSSSSSSESDGSDDEGDDDDEDSASSAAVAASSSSSPPHGLVMKDGMEVDASLEVAWVPPPPEGQIGAYPGLYLFTRSARIVRPVLNLQALKTELIGPLEQVRDYSHVFTSTEKRKREQQVEMRGIIRSFTACSCFINPQTTQTGLFRSCRSTRGRAISSPRQRAPFYASGARPNQHAELDCVLDAIQRLQPGPADHVPVPNGEANHGHAGEFFEGLLNDSVLLLKQ